MLTPRCAKPTDRAAPTAGAWTQVTIPLADLGGPASIARIAAPTIVLFILFFKAAPPVYATFS